MVEILHFSDTHAERETLRRIESLVTNLPDGYVVAHTGDAVSNFQSYASDKWNEWPQQYKLSVPGEHGETLEAYKNLTRWLCLPPWHCLIDDLLFIGVDSSHGVLAVPDPSEIGDEVAPGAFAGLVVLTHRWVYHNTSGPSDLADSIMRISHGTPVLVLHGHYHNEGSNGSFWDEDARLGPLSYYRSNVCSSSPLGRGTAHLITWMNGQFQCFQVQGD